MLRQMKLHTGLDSSPHVLNVIVHYIETVKRNKFYYELLGISFDASFQRIQHLRWLLVIVSLLYAVCLAIALKFDTLYFIHYEHELSLALMLSKSCATVMFGIQLHSTIQCHPEWIGICRGTWILDRMLFLNIHAFHHVLLEFHFIVMPCLFSSKGWQLTSVQHTRRLTHMRTMKYYSYTSYHHAAHEVWAMCSTLNIAHM